MVKINNPAVVKTLTDGLNIQVMEQGVISETTNVIQPVFNANPLPEYNQILDVGLNDSDKIIVVPNGKQWNVQWIMASLTADATVGSRNIQIRILDKDDNILWIENALNAQVASTTERYMFQKGIVEPKEVIATHHMIPLPTSLILTSGMKIRILDSGAISAAGDDLSIFILVGETAGF